MIAANTCSVSLIRNAPGHFADNYRDARAKFIAAATAANASLHHYDHTLRGPDGEAIAVDVARIGPAGATRMVIVVSGTHGVEALAGSGAQVGWLACLGPASVPADTAVLLVHVLNPWGCAWRRRQNEDNVDLNRNFLDFAGTAPPVNADYAVIHDLIVDTAPAVRARDDVRVAALLDGEGAVQPAGALFAGQYQHRDGVGFGGSSPTWSHRVMRQILDDHARQARQVVGIDIHTGLGPFGHGALLCLDSANPGNLERARRWFGPSVVSLEDAADVPYAIRGDLLSWLARQLDAQTTSLAIEFGTYAVKQMLELQIDDCRVQHRGEQASARGEQIRQEVEQFFYPATHDWLQSVFLRVAQTIELALDGLSGVAPRQEV